MLQTVFNVNDLVYLHNDHKRHKLDDQWFGPFRIHKQTHQITPSTIMENQQKYTVTG